MINFEKISLIEMESINGGFTLPPSEKPEIYFVTNDSKTIVDYIRELFKGFILW